MITKDYRVAILIAGQSRTYKVCLDNIRNFFSNLKTEDGARWIKIDYFLHTWDTNQWTDKGSDKMHLHNIPYERADIDKEFIYSTLNCGEHSKVVSMDIETYNPSRIHRAWGPSLYSQYKANLAKIKHEYAIGQVYDLVIKIRYDQIFTPNTRFKYRTFHRAIENRFLYTTTVTSRMLHELNSFNLDDVWFFADSPTMNLVMQTYNYIGQSVGEPQHKKSKRHPFYYPESLLGPGCFLNRFSTLINIHGIRACHNDYNYLVVRRYAEEQGWDPKYDYDKILEHSLAYYNK